MPPTVRRIDCAGDAIDHGVEHCDVFRRDLESECSRLKKMYADLALERHALKDVMTKKL